MEVIVGIKLFRKGSELCFLITLRLYKVGRLKLQSLGCLLHILTKEFQNLKNGATERNRYTRNVERRF